MLRPAGAIDGRPQAVAQIPERDGVAQRIGEIDGSMIPVVETAAADGPNPNVDCRTTRQVGWKEARLSLVHEPGALTPVFGATVGPPEEAGQDLLRAAVQAGLGRKTKVPAVSDGAPWMADQVQMQFGLQGEFLSISTTYVTPWRPPGTPSRARISGPGGRCRKNGSNRTACRT